MVCPLYRLGAVALGIALTLGIMGIQPEPLALQTAATNPKNTQEAYVAAIQPLLKTYCLSCHSTKVRKAGVDLEQLAHVAQVRKRLKLWQQVVEQLELGEMPPKSKPQPTAAEKQRLLDWSRKFIAEEIKARNGDPGFVPLRRLSNFEYDNAIRDLTGVDLRPTREFPADGAGGEGFTNAAESLTGVTPALLTKYLAAAKEVADHAVLLPHGIRFSSAKTRRDWTDECTRRLQQFYVEVAPPDGKLPLQPYLAATLRHRQALTSGHITIEQVARSEKLNAKYLGVLWHALTDTRHNLVLQSLRDCWRQSGPNDVAQVVAEAARLQGVLWSTANVANYVRTIGSRWVENSARQVPKSPVAVRSLPLRFTLKPEAGQSEVELHLVATDLVSPAAGEVRWRQPRLEAAGKPTLLLKDYSQYGKNFELNFAAVLADTSRYLEAVAEASRTAVSDARTLAVKHQLNVDLLARWLELLPLSGGRNSVGQAPLRIVPLDLELLDEKTERLAGHAWVNGWRAKGTDLPSLATNASNETVAIPGTVLGRSVVVHPTPARFVAVVWRSPISGQITVSGRVTHAHLACGNGVAWWLGQRTGRRTSILADGATELGAQSPVTARELIVQEGDEVVLAIDAKAGNHICDLTQVALTIMETTGRKRTWDLAADVADSIHAGNPHADRQGNQRVWSFVHGSTQAAAASAIPAGSLLAHWQKVAADPKRNPEAQALAKRIQNLLVGPRPSDPKAPDRLLYDQLVRVDGPLFAGLDLANLAKAPAPAGHFGLPASRFDNQGHLLTEANSVLTIRLPAGLMQDRAFVVDAELSEPGPQRVVQCQIASTPAPPTWNGSESLLADEKGRGWRQFQQELAEARALFPLFLCMPGVIPNDEVVSLKMFHREDEPLLRLFLNDVQARRLEVLWSELTFVSQQAVAENAYFPQFIGFVTQDQPKEALAFFLGQRPAFQRRADEFKARQLAAEPKHLEAVLMFASSAYRRPLTESQQVELRSLYQALRNQGLDHDAAVRGLLTRILTAPAFLFRLEKAPAGTIAAPVDDWELATRLSFFLWSSIPDTELGQLAAAGRLRDPKVLADQVSRMLKDPRLRSLAINFGTQWIHIRDFHAFNEKNERAFPTFTPELRADLYEEAILLFQELFQGNHAVTELLDADYTFLNERLAGHYAIPGIKGQEWRRVEGVKQHGRGGLLGLGAVQARQAGASRTSPILRGNWVVETLLGEKLPKPPPDVPKLPEAEGDDDQLTMRQLVERHTSVPECALCHQRIDPFGFALEQYDAIGRRREKEISGLKVDARGKLRDGTEVAGIDGLRSYLLTRKRDVFVRLFCKRLAGYALGRSVEVTDTQLLDDMEKALRANQGRVTAALHVLVQSPQFLKVRGGDFVE